MLFVVGLLAILAFAHAHLDGPLESYTQEQLISEIQSLRHQSQKSFNPFVTSNSAACCPAGKIAVCKGCELTTCGPNADCFVANEQITCFCRQGYVGDPKKGCKKSSNSGGNGDPHYHTLDGTYYDYHGTCPYFFSKPCKPSSSSSYYVVKAKNKLYNPRSSVAYVDQVQVEMHGQVIHLDANLNLNVNGLNTFYPFYFPSKTGAKVSVVLRGNRVHVKNSDGVQLVFGKEYISLDVPQVNEFLGKDGLCGFSGNLNNDCTDDLIGADGVGLIQKNCVYPADRNTLTKIAKVLDTWRTNDFYGWNPAGTGCELGEVVAPKLPDCDTTQSARDCLPIQQASNGQGPFAACKILGTDRIQKLYESCTFDGCYIPGSKCLSFTNFIAECQAAVGNLNLPNWRTVTGCPMNCAQITPFSVYDACISGCQPTCNNPVVTQECNTGCHEGCKCGDGYILDESANPPKCVKTNECPCIDKYGQSHPQGNSWLSNQCTELSVCLSGQIYERGYQCPNHSTCGTEDGYMACVCNAGYKWNSSKTDCIAA
ncbi:hypothetical protein QR680_000651 [Steinernema hermaphroditum]|uniref:VWFD domain-containing protein n=1 Tax=Steinernema hermaphroditum TaxID=289476 RepID=A0AA39LEN1_9BILA|nr:hypothetical protein QR680_000651 [Steinernema hermaphroditum]